MGNHSTRDDDCFPGDANRHRLGFSDCDKRDGLDYGGHASARWWRIEHTFSARDRHRFQSDLWGVRVPETDGDWSVVEGDFNSDGNLDVVSANRDSNSLTVFLGNGNGTFQLAQTIALSASPFGLVAGDLNHDGNLGLIVSPTNATSGGIEVLVGNGDGTFQAPAIIFPFGPDVDSCLTLSLADLNGDGNLDLVAGTTRREGISVLLGNGDGAFQVAVDYGLELGPIDQVKIADFNEDGRLDLVSTNESEVSILLGNGDGTFQNSVSYPLLSPVSIGVADFDRDGNADVVAVTINNGLFLLRGNGDGSFQSPQFISAGIDFGVETGISTVTENLT
jgi:hypothetical protein